MSKRIELDDDFSYRDIVEIAKTEILNGYNKVDLYISVSPEAFHKCCEEALGVKFPYGRSIILPLPEGVHCHVSPDASLGYRNKLKRKLREDLSKLLKE